MADAQAPVAAPTPTDVAGAGAPTPEAPAPPAVDAAAQAKVETPVSRAMAAIAKREREARRASEEAQSLAGKWAPLEQAAKAGDVQALLQAAGKIAGLPPESVMDAIVSSIADEGREKTPQEMVSAQVAEALDKQRQAAEAETRQRQEQEFSAARKDFIGRVERAARSSEAYPLIAHFGAADDVLDVVERWHAETGEFLGQERAMQLVEQKYRELLETATTRLKPSTIADSPSTGTASPSSLNNKTTGGVPVVATDEMGWLSEGERIRRAAARSGIRLP